VWKVYHIETGHLIKAGFDTEDQAKDWVERRQELMSDDHDVEEMDEEEVEEYLETADEDTPVASHYDDVDSESDDDDSDSQDMSSLSDLEDEESEDDEDEDY
jgi:hypothetical protein